MPSERIQRRIDAFLDEADVAASAGDWPAVAEKARAVLAMDPGNEDAPALLRAADANLGAPAATPTPTPPPAAPAATAPAVPESFAAARYHVRKFLGEGGKKRVFLAHDALLDRDVAFALIKTEGLDATGRERITREAQAMGRMGTHPHVVTIFEIGEEGGAPYVVTELLGGGDVEGMLEKAGGTVSLARALQVAKDVCDGLVFAHAQGIVHRDLKPGNVWLTADGTAKIGDFGLAVNLGRSRLTQHGLMVGTVAYMPPEQALGGEVTPQSDLYSLGAMLYELVTGKPPFQADDPTAVISQHINTPPVAPSWNSDRCPPDLEALILRLLAKVPADRPASAAEVLAALARVDPEAKSASHSDSSANPLDRLARGVFVGRERELERLRGAFDSAFAGRGSVVMLVGEPGIGKTRTTQELETYARLRGAQVLFGRANESSGAPPYYPWTQIARAYRAQNAEEVRRKEWGPYAVELQRVFAALRDLFPNLPEPPAIESEEAQFQLFDAMSGFVRDISERAPVLLVLDDLHWADRPTLLMLTHIARDLAHSRILVVGTYRDTDLDRTHPLSQTLGELNREQLFTRILLRGLAREEVAAYISAVAHVKPSPGLVARIFEETEGNPFFLGEVVNLLTQEGTLTRAGNASVSDLAIPEGVKEALGRRLDRLSPETNSLLQLAAIAGREFDHGLLVALTGQDDEAVLVLVEEALAGRVIEETDSVGEYRFTHALMQETLAGELSAARQVRLHGRIAEALEQVYGERADANAAELAQHFAESAGLNRAHAQKAARYSRLAAEQAAAQLAWDEAIRHYERCLAIVEEAPDHLGEDEAALWLGLALAQAPAVSWGASSTWWRSFDRAAERYSLRADPLERARPWLAVQDITLTGAGFLRPRSPVLDSVLAALDGQDSAERCLLLAFRARGNLGPAGDADAAAAAAIAERLGLGVRYTRDLLLRTQAVAQECGEFERVLAMGDALHEQFRGAGRDATNALNQKLLAALYLGDIAAAALTIEQLLAYGREQRKHDVEWHTLAHAAAVASRRGEYERCEALLAQLPSDDFYGPLVKTEAALATGDCAAALRASPGEISGSALEGVWRGTRARVFLGLSDVTAAQREFDAWLAIWRSTVMDPMGGRTDTIGGLAEAACTLGDEALRQELLAYLDRYPTMRGFGHASGNPADLRGRLALSLDRIDEAEQHFNTGLEWASRPDVRFLVDAGRCHQGLAEVAERRGDHAQAMKHLDAAGELFSQHGAKLFLDQVLAKKQFLKA